MHRLYETNDIVVFWNSDKCRHAKRCVTGSPKTFDITRRPWIDVTLAPTAEIWQTVSSCPTGALTCVYTHDITVEIHEDECRSVAYVRSASTGGEADTITERGSQNGDVDNIYEGEPQGGNAGRDDSPDDRIQIGECDYRDTPDGRVIYHTEVAPAYGGKSIARRLVYKVIESAEHAHLPIIPTCSYARKVMEE